MNVETGAGINTFNPKNPHGKGKYHKIYREIMKYLKHI